MKHHEAELLRVRVKIGIYGLHYHPSYPFLFHGFFQQSLFSFWNFPQFLIVRSCTMGTRALPNAYILAHPLGKCVYIKQSTHAHGITILRSILTW